MKETRPFEEQTLLEHLMRNHLWHPVDRKRRATEDLPGAVKRKDYAKAAECQTMLREAEADIKMWEELLTLYEAERTEWIRITKVANGIGHFGFSESPEPPKVAPAIVEPAEYVLVDGDVCKVMQRNGDLITVSVNGVAIEVKATDSKVQLLTPEEAAEILKDDPKAAPEEDAPSVQDVIHIPLNSVENQAVIRDIQNAPPEKRVEVAKHHLANAGGSYPGKQMMPDGKYAKSHGWMGKPKGIEVDISGEKQLVPWKDVVAEAMKYEPPDPAPAPAEPPKPKPTPAKVTAPAGFEDLQKAITAAQQSFLL